MALRDVIADIAAALSLLSGLRLITAIASLLLGLVPKRLRDEEPQISAELSERVAKDVAAVAVPDVFSANGIQRSASRDAIQYRAEYAVAAVERLSKAVLDAAPGERRAALAKAYKAERRYLAAHREVSAAREKAAKTTEAMVEQYGPRLVWKHGATRRPEEPRPVHKTADGYSFDLRRGIPAQTGTLPGVLPGCSCQWVAPSGGEPEM